MTDDKKNSERLWEKGWDGHEIAQLKRMASLPFQDKIIWLEEAQEMLLNAAKIEIRKEDTKARNRKSKLRRQQKN